MIEYKTIKQFAAESGYTEKAIREKIRKGVFPKNKVWLLAPDNRQLISVKGFNEWVINGQELLKEAVVASSLRLPTTVLNVEKELKAAPLLLI